MRFFQNYPDVLALMSNRRDGNMKIDHKDGRSPNEKRGVFFSKYNIPRNRVVSALLHHSNNVVVVRNVRERFIPKTDALVTGKKGIYLSVTNADCYPVFFFDPVGSVVGIAHAGWKGIVKDIVPNVIGKMLEMKSDPKDMRVVIGPGICHDCFEFGIGEAQSNFGKYYKGKYLPTVMKGKVCISLRGIIFDQLMMVGIRQSKIRISEECTYCNEGKFFSARRDNKNEGDTNKSIDSMVSIIGMKAA